MGKRDVNKTGSYQNLGLSFGYEHCSPCVGGGAARWATIEGIEAVC